MPLWEEVMFCLFGGGGLLAAIKYVAGLPRQKRKDTIDEMRLIIDQRNREIDQRNQEIIEMNGRLSKLEEWKDEADRIINELRTDKLRLESEKAALVLEAGKLQARLDEATAQISMSRVQIEDLTTQLSVAKQQINERDIRIAELQELILRQSAATKTAA
jgi:chromosome segregation ATPase